MATSKTLTPTNVTISIPTMTDVPDASVFSNCVDKEADAINALNSNLSNNVFQEMTPVGSRCTVSSGGVAVVGKFAVINVKIHSAHSATNTPSMLYLPSEVGIPKCVASLTCVKSGTGYGSISGAIACHVGVNRQVYLQSVENDAYYDISGVVVLE